MAKIAPTAHGNYDSGATAINDLGQIAGRKDSGAQEPDLFILDGGRTHWPPGSHQNAAEDMNERGQLVGWDDGVVQDSLAMLWTLSNGRVTARPVPSPRRPRTDCPGRANGINQYGQ